MPGQTASNDDIFKLLKEVAETNKQIKQELIDIKAEFKSEINSLKLENSRLETEISQLKSRLQITEKNQKKYNFIIYGIKESNKTASEALLDILNNVVKVNCNVNNFRDICRIGSIQENKVRPILAETLTYQLKFEILNSAKSNSKSLRDQGIFFAYDYTSQDYSKRKLLHEHLKLAREKHYDAKIVKNKLVVNGEAFTYEQLKSTSPLEIKNPNTHVEVLSVETHNKENNLENITNFPTPLKSTSSAPPTPTRNSPVFFQEIDTEGKKRKFEDTPSKVTGTKPKTSVRQALKRTQSINK